MTPSNPEKVVLSYVGSAAVELKSIKAVAFAAKDGQEIARIYVAGVGVPIEVLKSEWNQFVDKYKDFLMMS